MDHRSKDERALAAFLEELGPSAAVDRFLRGYGNVRTRCSYAGHLALYLRWLKDRGTEATPDALIQDNLKAVFESTPTDVTAKRKHVDLLGEYVNGYMLQRAAGDSTRKVASAAIRRFYESNDSALFGFYQVAEQAPTLAPPPLCAEDIRKVLLAMPVRSRTPLVVAWQTSIEINRVLETDWSFALDKEPPVKVELPGRKLHRKPYSTFMGADSVKHLKLMGPGNMPDYSTVLNHLHFAARKLGEGGLLKNPRIDSWHPHALRHSFETEAAHAGVKAEVRDFFLGHLKGIQWVYNHRDELHPEDLVLEYQKVEPFVSLDYTEASLKSRYQDREKEVLSEYLRLRRDFEALKAEFLASRSENPSQR